jgi:transposase
VEKFTLKELARLFPNDGACLEEIRKLKWPQGINCAKCKKITKFYKVKNRTSYACEFCGSHVYPLVGTIFEKSATPLTIWFLALYLMVQTRCNISIKQLQRSLGVTYKTAWRMHKHIKAVMPDSLLTGFVGAEVLISDRLDTKLWD